MTETDKFAMKMYYIGADDCRVASSPRKQEFPDDDSPYCIHHALAEHMEKKDA